MKSTAFAVSPAFPFPKPHSRYLNYLRFNPPISLELSSIPCHTTSFHPSASRNSTKTSVSVLFSSRRYSDVNVRAARVPESVDETGDTNSLARTLQLGSLFGIWYFLNIYFNIYNKQVLEVYPFPATVTAFQFGCGTLLITLMWAFNLYRRPKINTSQLAAILPLAVAHTMGNLLTNKSIGKVADLFTQTIKAMEPFFTVVVSDLFLGERPTLLVVSSLVPIVCGVALASFTESSFTHSIKAMEPFLTIFLTVLFLGEFDHPLQTEAYPSVVSSLVPIVGRLALASFTESSFNWTGFYRAMAFNVTNQSRNVLSKKLMVKKEETLDNINLFSVMTIISFIMLVPMAIIMEGIKFSPSYLQSAATQGLNIRELWVRSLLAGICFHSYQQVSYTVLMMVSPVTHAVGNCVKRVVVIVFAIIFFQTPVSPINSVGTGVALAGVFLYSIVKRIKPKEKES